MRKILDTLIELQDIDSQIQILEEARGDLPQKVNELSYKVEAVKEVIEEKKVERKTKVTRKHAAEGDISLLKEKLKKYQGQLYQVKNNKEYDAITNEIELCKTKIDQMEFEVLELDESISAITSKLTDSDKELVDLEASLVENKEYLTEMLAKTKAEEDVLTEKRVKLLTLISRSVYTSYERIRLNRGGKALALLNNGACGECSSRIPPQRGMEIRMMDTLFYCEVCGRILVWKPDN